MTVGIVTDGQVDVNKALVDQTRLNLQAVGGLQAAQAFKGNITFSGGVITRANGSDLGNFIAEGFQKGMRIRLAGTSSSADGDYVITDPDATTLTVTPAPIVPADAHTPPGTRRQRRLPQLADRASTKATSPTPERRRPDPLHSDLSSTGTTTLTRRPAASSTTAMVSTASRSPRTTRPS